MNQTNYMNRTYKKTGIHFIWMILIILTVFIMTYSEGLHLFPEYFSYHYYIIGIAYLILFILSVKGVSSLIKSGFGIFTNFLLFSFLINILVSSILVGVSTIHSIHIVLWHLFIYFFWIIFLSQGKNGCFINIKNSQLSFVVLAFIALLVGLYIKHIGPFSIMSFTLEQPLYRGVEHFQLFSWFRSPNELGPFLMYGIVAAITLVPFYNKRYRGFLCLIIFILTTGVLLVGSRTAIFATFIFILVRSIPWLHTMLIHFFKSRQVKLTALFCMLVFYFFTELYGGLATMLQQSRITIDMIQRTDGIIDVDNRSEIFIRAVEFWLDSSLPIKIFGGGPYYIIKNLNVSTHNGWLEIFTSYGLVGFSLALFGLFYFIFKSYMRYATKSLDIPIRLFYLSQLAFWIAFATLNISLSRMFIPRFDGFYMLLMLAQFAHMEYIVKKAHKGRQVRSIK